MLALVLVVELWCQAIAGKVSVPSGGAIAVALASLAGPLALWPRTRSLGFAGLAVAELAAISESFPWTGNHRYFEVTLCLIAAVADGRVAEDRRILLRAVQWFTVVVLFYSGLQKLVHGFYFGGHYLAYMLHEESFRTVLGILVPTEELARLATMRRAVGAGPYVIDRPLFLVASNAVYVAEMGLAALLLWPRSRAAAVVGAGLLIGVIELAARELFFGLLFTNAVLTFWPKPMGKTGLVAFAALCAAALLVRLGLAPEVTFH